MHYNKTKTRVFYWIKKRAFSHVQQVAVCKVHFKFIHPSTISVKIKYWLSASGRAGPFCCTRAYILLPKPFKYPFPKCIKAAFCTRAGPKSMHAFKCVFAPEFLAPGEVSFLCFFFCSLLHITRKLGYTMWQKERMISLHYLFCCRIFPDIPFLMYLFYLDIIITLFQFWRNALSHRIHICSQIIKFLSKKDGYSNKMHFFIKFKIRLSVKIR